MVSLARSLKQSLGWGRASASEQLGSLRQRGFLLDRSEGNSWALYLWILRMILDNFLHLPEPIPICEMGILRKWKVLVSQLFPTLCNPIDCSPPGSSIHGILQARILEWVAIPFSRGSSNPGIKSGFPTLHTDSSLSEPLCKPWEF